MMTNIYAEGIGMDCPVLSGGVCVRGDVWWICGMTICFL